MKQTIYLLAFTLVSVFITNAAFSQGMAINTTVTVADASAMLDVTSATQGVLVPRMTTAQRNAISSPATGLLIFQTDGTTGFYYYTGSAWSLVGSVGSPLTIGASFGGGMVAYILQPGYPGYSALEQHGLIAATSDQSTGQQWASCYNVFEGAAGFLLGTGRNNTETLYRNCGAGGAYSVCKSYFGGGFTDWYLPSMDELNKLYISRGAIGSFASGVYWSSSESVTYTYSTNYGGWGLDFGSGSQSVYYRYNSNYVRTVRSF